MLLLSITPSKKLNTKKIRKTTFKSLSFNINKTLRSKMSRMTWMSNGKILIHYPTKSASSHQVPQESSDKNQ